MTSGIYAIKNKINGKTYIGLANNIERRFKFHKSRLKNNHHGNNHLQRAWNIDGEDSFEFIIIENCEVEKLPEREIFWINFYDSKNKGYNQTDGGDGTVGYKPSDLTRARISAAQKLKIGTNNQFFGKKHTEESRMKISNSLKGKPSYMKGKKHSELSRIKMSISAKGRQPWIAGKLHSEESRLKMSQNHTDVSGSKNPFYGKEHSQETKEIMKKKRTSLETQQKWQKSRDENRLNKMKNKIIEMYGVINIENVHYIIENNIQLSNNKTFSGYEQNKQRELLEQLIHSWEVSE